MGEAKRQKFIEVDHDHDAHPRKKRLGLAARTSDSRVCIYRCGSFKCIRYA